LARRLVEARYYATHEFPLICVLAHTHIMERPAMTGCAERYKYEMI
jgi:hypothetical protein